jgi:hypothetical protein
VVHVSRGRKARAVNILVSSTVIRRTALPSGHSRPATVRTAASASGEPSTPISRRKGVPEVWLRLRPTRTEQWASVRSCVIRCLAAGVLWQSGRVSRPRPNLAAR